MGFDDPMATTPSSLLTRADAAWPTKDVTGLSARIVLYVEDDAANVRHVDLLLEQRPGLRLLSADRGQLGLELAGQHRSAVILLDVHLPDIEGTELLLAIRQDAIIWRTPVIVLSAPGRPLAISAA
jgi:CheY-like chemotaxis protein